MNATRDERRRGRRPRTAIGPFAAVVALCAVGCSEPQTHEEIQSAMEEAAEAGSSVAIATLRPTAGHDATGEVRFERLDSGVRILADVQGLDDGAHGFHIHAIGDCSAPDASSAGGHFAPHGSPHGAPSDPVGRHVGDLGNLRADGGSASYERIDSMLRLDGENSIIGKAVIVHANADDFVSQPSGAAGARVACGVIAWSDDS